MDQISFFRNPNQIQLKSRMGDVTLHKEIDL